MISIQTRLASLAVLVALASGCGIQAESELIAQQVATGDPQVVARRILDLEAMRLEGKIGVAVPHDLSFALYTRQTPAGEVLALEDLETGQVRDVTGPYQYVFSSYYPSGISPDGEWVAVGTQRGIAPLGELKLVRLDGGDERILISYDGPDSPVDWADAFSWSHDGTKILTLAWMRDGSTRLEMFSRDDGTRVLLKAFDWRAPGWVAFSPDDRFVVYDFQSDEDDPSSDIYALATDGSSERRLTNDPSRKRVIGWSSDGTAIYYSAPDSERRTASVWRLPMRGDRPAGPATLVRRDVAGAPDFLIRDDRVLYRINPDAPAMWTASLDLMNDRVVAPPSHFLELKGRQVAGARFDWALDGLSFTYNRVTNAGRPAVEIVLVPASGRGDERVTRLDGIEYITGRMPFGDDAILVRGQRPERPGYGDLLRVDLRTGAVTPIEDPRFEDLRRGDFPMFRSFSEDMSTLYLRREREDATEIIARNMTDGTERVVHRVAKETGARRSRINYEGPSLSPDGSQLAFLVYDDVTDGAQATMRLSNELRVVSVEGGPARIVHEGWIGGASLNWTSDSRSLVFRDVVTQGARGGQVWRASADGSSKMLLFSMPSGLGGIRLSPDDRRVVFSGPVERRVEELWVLENLPETRAAAASISAR